MSEAIAPPTYTPIQPEGLTDFIREQPLSKLVPAEWAAKIAPHRRTNRIIGVVTDPSQRLPLDCVGVRSNVQPADAEKIRSMGALVCPNVDYIIETYKQEEYRQRLEAFATLLLKPDRKERTAAVFEHSSLMNLPLGSMCLMAALYELELLEPKNVRLNMVVSDMLKYTAVNGQPIVNIFMDGLFNYLQFLYPQTDSVTDSSILSSMRDRFNKESIRQDLTYQSEHAHYLKLFCPSGQADKSHPDDPSKVLHMAPFGISFSMFRRFHTLSMGLNPQLEPPAVFVGELRKPLEKPVQADEVGQELAQGMTMAGSRTTYHTDLDDFRAAIGKTPRGTTAVVPS